MMDDEYGGSSAFTNFTFWNICTIIDVLLVSSPDLYLYPMSQGSSSGSPLGGPS